MAEALTLDQLKNQAPQEEPTQSGPQTLQQLGAAPMSLSQIKAQEKVTFDTHKYDSQIEDAAKPYGEDPNMLRAIAGQETGYGQSAQYDPKTGLSKVPGNAGHGVFQLDPSSGASQADLDRAAKDPAFAAQRAAEMMHKNLTGNKDMRDALAVYHSGSKTKEGYAYADSVLAQMHKLDPVRLAQTTPPPRASQASILGSIDQLARQSDAVRHAVNKAGAAVTGAQVDARRHPSNTLLDALSVLQRPTTAIAADLMNGKWNDPKQVFGHAWQAAVSPETNQKYVDSLETAMVHDMGLADMKLKGASMTEEDHRIDNAMTTWNAKDLHGLGKFLADTVTETIADPLTYLPIADIFTVGSRVSGALAKAVHSAGGLDGAIKMMGPLGKSPRVIEFFNYYKKFMDESQGAVKDLGAKLHDLTNRREELDHLGAKQEGHTAADNNGFTHTGKLARFAVENRAGSAKNVQLQKNADILKQFGHELKANKYGDAVPDKVQRHMLMEAYEHGTVKSSQEAEALLVKLGQPLTDAERKMPHALGHIDYKGPLQENYMTKIIPAGLKGKTHFKDDASKKAYEYMASKGKDIEMPFAKPVTAKLDPELAKVSQYDLIKNRMELGAEAVRRARIAKDTADLYRRYGAKVLKHQPSGETSLEEYFAKYAPDKAGLYKFDNAALHASSELMKRGILANPFVHGLVNVGSVTLMRSNPLVFGRGLAYALGRTPKILEHRLAEIGGKPNFWKNSKVPFAPPWTAKSQDWLERFDTGFRASYLQHLDKTMGVLEAPKFDEAGKLLSAGDPNWLLHELNKGATVDTHIGTAAHPTKIAAWFKGLGGLYTNFRLDTVPGALAAGVKGRPGQTVSLLGRAQHNFSQQEMPGGSELEFFGPYNDAARAIYSTLDFGTSIASAGPGIGGISTALKNEAKEQFSAVTDDLTWFGDYVLPGMSSMMRLYPSMKDAMGVVKKLEPDPAAQKEIKDILKHLHMTEDSNPAPYWVRSLLEAALGGNTRFPDSKSTNKHIRRGLARLEDR